jgi:hypothetical protein
MGYCIGFSATVTLLIILDGSTETTGSCWGNALFAKAATNSSNNCKLKMVLVFVFIIQTGFIW